MAHVSSRPSVPPPQSPGQPTSVKILLAEDSPVTRLMLAATLREAAHEVVTAENGADAWAAFEREPAPMVILDWLMPELDGLTVCRRIRESAAGRDTFILVVTGRDTADDVAEALAAGADDYVTKPVTPAFLRARLTIAERRIAQNLVRRLAEEALARAQWLAGIGQTSLALQHEINNPLTALLAEAELLASDGELAEAQRLQVRTISSQARRIGEVIRQLARLDDPRTVEYIRGARMLDLSSKPH